MTDAQSKAKPATSPRSSQALAVVGTALVAVIVVLVNYISFRRYERWDLTRDQIFTLSARTEEVLKALPKPVDIYLFMSSGEPNFQEMRELLTRYQSKTDKLTVHTVDPDREPARFRMLAEEFGVRVALHEGGQTEAELAVLAVSGDKRWSITREDLVEIDYDSLEGQGQTPKVNVKTEQALTGALVLDGPRDVDPNTDVMLNGFWRSADTLALVSTDDLTGATEQNGFLRSPAGSLVAVFDGPNAVMDRGFLRTPEGALSITLDFIGARIQNGFLRTADQRLVII